MDRKDKKTNQIIEAATIEFLNKGFDSASMHNIALTAEVSKRTLYKYYSTKDELYSALIDKVLDEIDNIFKFEYSKEIPLEKQLESIIIRKIEFTLSDDFLNISKIIIGELLKSRSLSPEQLRRMNNTDLLFYDWILQASKDGKIKSNLSPEIIANQFHSVLKSEMYWPVLLGLKKKEDLDLEQIKVNTLNFFINAFT